MKKISQQKKKMKQVFNDSLNFIQNHPVSAVGSSATGVLISNNIPMQTTTDLILKIVTLLVGLIPAFKQIFTKKNNQ